MNELPKPLAVVCHDAGTANLILPWIGPMADSVLPVMEGPAAILWQRRFASTPTLSLEDAVARAAAVLSGTGWASDLEHRARKLATQKGVPSVGVVDHWVNYRDRFNRDGEEILPDAIWVTDEYALAIAQAAFPGLNIELKPNLYLEEQVAGALPVAEDDHDVLFVAEPIRSDWQRGTPGEFQALDYFFENRGKAGIPSSATIRLRPHPSDPAHKYDAWAATHRSVEIDRSGELSAALAGARWVVGCESYALVVGLHAGRKTISALPPWAPPCRLPHKEIVHLADL